MLATGTITARHRWCLHLVLQILKTHLQLEDPLFFIVRSEFACMVRKLGSTVAFKHACKVSDLSFKFLIWFMLPHQIIVAVLVGSGCTWVGPLILALTLLLSILSLRRRLLHGLYTRIRSHNSLRSPFFLRRWPVLAWTLGILSRIRGFRLSSCLMCRLIFCFRPILTLNLCLLLNVFSCPFSLLRILLFLFTLLLRLHDVVHEVVEVFIIDLFVSVVILRRICLKLLALAFISSPFLLPTSLPLPHAVKVISSTILGKAAAHTFSALSLPLMHLKLVAIIECLIAGERSPFTWSAHRLLVLLLPLQLLLLLHKLGARVLV